MRKRKYFTLVIQHMQHRLAFLVLLCIGALPLLPARAQSPTTPQDMPISLSKPKPPGQTGLRRPVGDGNVWTFRVVPEPGIVWVEGPNWSYPGKGEGADPDWGQWGGGDGQMWLSWSSPQKAAPFKIRMTGKIGKPGSGGGEPVDVEASWEGEVEIGESSATLKLYKDAALTEEATGVIGGTVYVALEVKLGRGQKLASDGAILRIEEEYELHSEAERRWEQTVNFADGWQKKDANDEWQSTEGTPKTINDTGEDKYFRKAWAWATYSKPLGHNEEHTVQLIKVDSGEDTELSFTPTRDGDDGKDGPQSLNTDVSNLVITDVSTNAGNPGYFLFDPDSTEQSFINPSISFTFENNGDPAGAHNRYHWWLWVRATDETNFATYEGYLDAPGEKSVSIEPSNLPSTGPYAFDIHVLDTKTGDWQGIISTKLKLNLHKLHLVNAPNADLDAQISYQITSDRDAQELTVDLFDPSLNKLKSYQGGKEKNYLYEDINLYTFEEDDIAGTYIAVFTAKDDFSEQYRDHRSRNILAINKRSIRDFLEIWKDGASWDWLHGNYLIGWRTIQRYFIGIGIPIRLWAGGGGNAGIPTAGSIHTRIAQNWSITYQSLSQSQKELGGKTVIVVGLQSSSIGGEIDKHLGVFSPTGGWNLDPSSPGLAAIAPYAIDSVFSGYTENQKAWVRTNVIGHEISHALLRNKHCGDWTSGVSSKYCMIGKEASNHFAGNLANHNSFSYKGESYRTPWHHKNEINQMRREMNLEQF